MTVIFYTNSKLIILKSSILKIPLLKIIVKYSFTDLKIDWVENVHGYAKLKLLYFSFFIFLILFLL